MVTKELRLQPAPSAVRRMAFLALRGASRLLAQLARTVSLAGPRAPVRAPVLEFYAEAGAPEGALYVDGHLVGHLPGVTRL